MPETTITFDEWLAELDARGGDRYGAGKVSENTGAECWRGYFDDGYSPQDALDEDWSYACC